MPRPMIIKFYELHEMVEWYLLESGGDRWLWREQMLTPKSVRLGQAFFNSLSVTDQAKLRGTDRDTFYRDGYEARNAILDTLDFLTSK